MKPSLAMAYSIKKKNMSKGGECFAKGGEVQDQNPHEAHSVLNASSLVAELRRKHARKMAEGGEVNDDFLSDEENTALPNEEEIEVPQDKKKRMLSRAFEQVRARHKGG